MEILSIQIYSDILNTRDERYLKFPLLLKRFYEYFFEYSSERELNSLERDWILFVYWKLLRIALLSCCIYRGWSDEAHLKYTWTYSCACTLKNNPCALPFVAWDASVAKNVLFQVKNVLKNILFFLAIWDSPREVVIQLCMSCNWLW